MELRDKQMEFSKALANLILYAQREGYDIVMADVFRNPKVFGAWGIEEKGYGSMWSVHKISLAADLELFKDNKWLDKGEEMEKGHNLLHDKWEEFGGAKRIKNDLNHYSFEYKGVR